MDRVTRRPVPIVALDFADAASALDVVQQLGDLCRFYKVGSELFTAGGPAVVAQLRDAGCDVMLDLKFHDIPNTVAGAVSSARRLGVAIVTVHAAGGATMLRSAVDAAGEKCQVFAVTLLTSLDRPAVEAIWGREGIEVGPEVVRLAEIARAAGATGVVASGSEVAMLKSSLGEELRVLVPGVRLAGSDAGDQSRVVTPAAAARLGADYVVIGRTVTASPARRSAMEKVLEELRNPVSDRGSRRIAASGLSQS